MSRVQKRRRTAEHHEFVGYLPTHLLIPALFGACVAVCCSVLQCVAVCCSVVVLQCCSVVCCSVVQWLVRVLQHVAVFCGVCCCVAVCCSVWWCAVACCRMLHCVVVRDGVMQLVAIWCKEFQLVESLVFGRTSVEHCTA